MNGSSSTEQAETYIVPSASIPDRFHTVHLFHEGATSCDCPWGSSERATSKCWHVRLAQCLEHAEEWTHFHSEWANQARGGHVQWQLEVMIDVIRQLTEQRRFTGASRAAEVLEKYLQAVGVNKKTGATKVAPTPAAVAA